MKKACVVGNPISHSLSPKIFNLLNSKLNKTHISYSKETPIDLNLFKRNVQMDKNWVGFNVTYPFKEKIIHSESNLSQAVKDLKSSNVVYKNQRDELCFDNTDWKALYDCLENYDLNQIGVLGFGNTTRAVLYACALKKTKSVNVFVRNPNNHEFQNFLENKFGFKIIFHNLYDIKNFQFSLLINSLPLDLDLSLPHVFSEKCWDLNYIPSFFSKQYPVCDNGLEMLVRQAVYTWEIWCEPIESKENLIQSLLEEL